MSLVEIGYTGTHCYIFPTSGLYGLGLTLSVRGSTLDVRKSIPALKKAEGLKHF